MHGKPAFLATLALAVGFTAAQPIPTNVTFRNFFGPTEGTAGAITFARPMKAIPYPGQDSLFLVLQQNGRIVTVGWQGGSWVKTDSASITVTGGTSGGNEQGLLGFAFHPEFNTNPRYYVYYISGSNSIIAERIAVTMRPGTNDPQRNLMTISQPFSNHNGGTIEFGPDGYLYIGLGDGGSGGDPGNRAQNTTNIHGNILRINVNAQDPGSEYAVPADNPFVGQSGYLPEIWAYGLRNPWKWSFHPLTNDLWVGDVGQEMREEITIAPKGANLGWRMWEGNFCYAGPCSQTGMTMPAISIQRSQGASITGGQFFIGDTNSAFHETYIFGDYVTNRVWAYRRNGTAMTDSTVLGTITNVVSFDRDAKGRILASSLNGTVWVLESPDMILAEPVNVRPGRALREAAQPITRADFLRNPERFEVRGLDGRALRGNVSGAVWVREKGSSNPPQLITIVQ